MLKLDKSKKYLLACSYGPDSMALFDMLLKEGFQFEVAHVNYHLRKESDDEEACLREFCERNNVVLHVLDVKEKISKNVEAKCREIRYSFFSECVKNYRLDALLVAHHQDDLLETFLLQKKRKNLVKHYGLSQQIYLNNMIVLRPLLTYKKDDLINYCLKNNISYSIDKTNLEPVYERNKIRLSVINKLTDADRKQMIDEINVENNRLKKMFDGFKCIGNDFHKFIQLSDIEKAYFLNENIIGKGSFKPITYKQSIEIVRILKNKQTIHLALKPQKVTISKMDDKMYFLDDSLPFENLIIDKPCIVDSNYLFVDLINEGRRHNIHDTDYPITIRPYQKGDKYQIKNYLVSVRRLFIDWKLPLPLRKTWPLFVNKAGQIIYIPRYQKDFKIENSPNFFVKERFTLK